MVEYQEEQHSSLSHDRYFIDETAEIVYELTDKKLVRYVGNYTQFRQQKLKNLAIWKKQYEQQQAELERLNQLVERFKHKPKRQPLPDPGKN